MLFVNQKCKFEPYKEEHKDKEFLHCNDDMSEHLYYHYKRTGEIELSHPTYAFYMSNGLKMPVAGICTHIAIDWSKEDWNGEI